MMIMTMVMTFIIIMLLIRVAPPISPYSEHPFKARTDKLKAEKAFNPTLVEVGIPT